MENYDGMVDYLPNPSEDQDLWFESAGSQGFLPHNLLTDAPGSVDCLQLDGPFFRGFSIGPFYKQGFTQQVPLSPASDLELVVDLGLVSGSTVADPCWNGLGAQTLHPFQISSSELLVSMHDSVKEAFLETAIEILVFSKRGFCKGFSGAADSQVYLALGKGSSHSKMLCLFLLLDCQMGVVHFFQVIFWVKSLIPLATMRGLFLQLLFLRLVSYRLVSRSLKAAGLRWILVVDLALIAAEVSV